MKHGVLVHLQRGPATHEGVVSCLSNNDCKLRRGYAAGVDWTERMTLGRAISSHLLPALDQRHAGSPEAVRAADACHTMRMPVHAGSVEQLPFSHPRPAWWRSSPDLHCITAAKLRLAALLQRTLHGMCEYKTSTQVFKTTLPRTPSPWQPPV